MRNYEENYHLLFEYCYFYMHKLNVCYGSITKKIFLLNLKLNYNIIK